MNTTSEWVALQSALEMEYVKQVNVTVRTISSEMSATRWQNASRSAIATPTVLLLPLVNATQVSKGKTAEIS